MMYFISFLLGLICSFGQPPFNYVIASICALALFFHFLLNHSNFSKIWFSYSFGYGYCIYSVHWFSESLLTYGDSLLWLIPFGLILMPAFFALYFALAGYLIARFSYGNIFMLAMIWLAIELMRSYLYIEFPWLLIGYIWSESIIKQSASIFGIWGLSFLTIIWVGAIMQTIQMFCSKKQNMLKQSCYITLIYLSFLFCYFYGHHHINAPLTAQNTKVMIIQPNINQNIQARMQETYQNLLKMIELSQNSNADYVIWPEGANEYSFDKKLASFIKHAAPENGALIFNASRTEVEQHWNSLFVLNRDGDILDYYDKIRLVPLGEFIPFKLRKILPFINKITPGSTDYSPGNDVKIMNIKNPFLPNICYEAVFPSGSSHQFTWIVNLTNDGWFGNSIGPSQHLAMAQFRSIEQGVPMARAALTGISAIIDSFGNLKNYIPLLQAGTIETTLPSYITNFTYYHLYGNYMLCILVLIIFCYEYMFKSIFKLQDF